MNLDTTIVEVLKTVTVGNVLALIVGMVIGYILICAVSLGVLFIIEWWGDR